MLRQIDVSTGQFETARNYALAIIIFILIKLQEELWKINASQNTITASYYSDSIKNVWNKEKCSCLLAIKIYILMRTNSIILLDLVPFLSGFSKQQTFSQKFQTNRSIGWNVDIGATSFIPSTNSFAWGRIAITI